MLRPYKLGALVRNVRLEKVFSGEERRGHVGTPYFLK